MTRMAADSADRLLVDGDGRLYACPDCPPCGDTDFIFNLKDVTVDWTGSVYYDDGGSNTGYKFTDGTLSGEASVFTDPESSVPLDNPNAAGSLFSVGGSSAIATVIFYGPSHSTSDYAGRAVLRLQIGFGQFTQAIYGEFATAVGVYDGPMTYIGGQTEPQRWSDDTLGNFVLTIDTTH